jgi:hypothetical protein
MTPTAGSCARRCACHSVFGTLPPNASKVLDENGEAPCPQEIASAVHSNERRDEAAIIRQV